MDQPRRALVTGTSAGLGRAIALFGRRVFVLLVIAAWIGGLLLSLIPSLLAIVLTLVFASVCGILTQASSTSFVAMTAKTATKMWSYNAMPNINNVIMGDVQRMPNGNTIVAYSTQGVVHEVDSAGTLLQSLSWGTGGAIGYIIKRASLYGKPPR